MKRVFGLSLLALAAACTPATPAASGPEAVVEKIYQTLVDSKGSKTTPLADIPMTDDLKALVDKAEAAGQARNEPVFDGDFAGNCQDCSGFTALKVAPKADARLAAGHKAVEASFKLYADVPRTVTWDMVEAGGGWRADNIVSDGVDLRKVAQESIDTPVATPAPTEPAPTPSTPTPNQ